MKNIRILYNRLLVEVPSEKERTAGGLFIPEGFRDKRTVGKIVALGSGRDPKTGRMHDMDFKIGDYVFFEDDVGSKVHLDGRDYLEMRNTDVLAVSTKGDKHV